MPIVTCADIGQSLTDAFNDPNKSSAVKDAIRNALDCDCAQRDLVFRIRVPQNVIDDGAEIKVFNMFGSEMEPHAIKMDWGDGVGTNESASNPYKYTASGEYTVTVFYNASGNASYRVVNFYMPYGYNVELLEVITFGHFEKVTFGGVRGNFGVPSQLSPTMTDLKGMFNGAEHFNQPIGSWDTSAVTSMSRMFDTASNFNQDISGWDTSAVTDMYQMFRGASAFNQDLSTWNVTKVTECERFSVGASGWMLPKPALTCSQ